MATNSSASIIDTGRKKFRSLLMSTGSQRKTNSGMDAAVSPWLATRLVTTGMSVFVSLPRTAMWACSSLHNQRHRFGVGETGQEQSFSWMFYPIFPLLVPWMIAMHAGEYEPESHWLSTWCHSEPPKSSFITVASVYHRWSALCHIGSLFWPEIVSPSVGTQDCTTALCTQTRCTV